MLLLNIHLLIVIIHQQNQLLFMDKKLGKYSFKHTLRIQLKILQFMENMQIILLFQGSDY